jgi:hypothetical protein
MDFSIGLSHDALQKITTVSRIHSLTKLNLQVNEVFRAGTHSPYAKLPIFCASPIDQRYIFCQV